MTREGYYVFGRIAVAFQHLTLVAQKKSQARVQEHTFPYCRVIGPPHIARRFGKVTERLSTGTAANPAFPGQGSYENNANVRLLIAFPYQSNSKQEIGWGSQCWEELAG
jgi:hypothetical protein